MADEKTTSALLPAHKVCHACDLIESEIIMERMRIKWEIARAYRWKSIWRWFCSTQWVSEHLPPGLDIAEFHRKTEHDSVRAVHDLALAAFAHSEDFTIQIGAADFQHLKKKYPL